MHSLTLRDKFMIVIALRTLRRRSEPREWEFEPSSFKVRLRQATCILGGHRWREEGMGVNEADHAYTYRDCDRCGIVAFHCLECDPIWADEDAEEY